MKFLVQFLFLIIILVEQTFAQTATSTNELKVQTASMTSAVTLYEGRFVPQEGDSSELVKGVLLRQAHLAALIKELKFQDLDSVLFVKKLDEAFAKEVEGVTQRQQRLEKLIAFADIGHFLEGILVKEEGVNPKNSNERFVRLEGKRNSDFARQLYYKIVRGGDFKFSSLILISELELVNCTYSDLFVQDEGMLLSSLGTSWKKWLGEGLSKSVAEIRLGQKSLEEKMNKDLKEPKRSTEFEKSLYLRLKLRLEKIKDNVTMGEREFVLRGEYGLLDLETNSLILSGVMEDTKFSIFTLGTSPASDLANTIYRFPLGTWTSLFKKLEDYNQKTQSASLQITGVDSITKLLSLGKMLETEGTAIKLKARMDSYTGQEARFQLNYQGEMAALLAFFKALHQKNTEAGDQVFYNPEAPLVLELKKAGGNK